MGPVHSECLFSFSIIITRTAFGDDYVYFMPKWFACHSSKKLSDASVFMDFALAVCTQVKSTRVNLLCPVLRRSLHWHCMRALL
jgi:hypothetical protein